MSKNALVINGGISRGAFAVGAIRKMQKIRPDIEFDILVGTGTGSLITPFVALGDTEPLVEIFTTKNNKDIIRKFALAERLHESSILDAGPFWGLLDHYYTHQLYNELLTTKKQLYFNTVCLQTHELTVFSDKVRTEIATRYPARSYDTYDQFLRTLMACSCQPLLMPPITVLPAENPVRQYVDAGDHDQQGIDIAIAAGATDIYTLLLSPPAPANSENREFGDLYSILQQTLDIFIADEQTGTRMKPLLYNEGLRYIQSVKHRMLAKGVPNNLIEEWFDTGDYSNPYYNQCPVNIHIIRPDNPLGGGPDGLSFDPARMRTMLQQGEEKMQSWLTANTPALNPPTFTQSPEIGMNG